MYCSKCGSELRNGDKFCAACGAEVVIPADGQPGQQQTQQQGEQAQQQPYQQNQQQHYQTGYQDAYNEISSARTTGILSIVFACTITLVGLILGLVGTSKVKKIMNVPPEYTDLYNSAKILNTIGLWLAVGFMGLAFLIGIISGCTGSYY